MCMSIWKCQVCGYETTADTQPSQCSQCHANNFVKLESEDSQPKYVDKNGVKALASAIIGSTKTINGQSVWGSGNISISGGSQIPPLYTTGPLYLCASLHSFNGKGFDIESALSTNPSYSENFINQVMSQLESLTGIVGSDLLDYLLLHNSVFTVTDLDYSFLDSEASISSVSNPAFFRVVQTATQDIRSDYDASLTRRFTLIGEYWTMGSTQYKFTTFHPGSIVVEEDFNYVWNVDNSQYNCRTAAYVEVTEQRV